MIGELVEEFDVTARTIRFYEERGLISPDRNARTRVYDERDRVRLRLILRGKRLGFDLEEVREMLSLYELDDGEARQLEHCIEVGRDKIAALERQREDVEATLADLRGFERRFIELLREKRDEPPAVSGTPGVLRDERRQ
ncbi:MerR family transcriptional regulator [Rubrobacter aplysinae]|uniref:MerR family transcriptional regulator n=1 Tax=Rubrobacter aplysinae TaxID=909625 RepID=UPI00064B95A6|nr:MerR family DNA-binding transcriptional regulator [Rubrobacter aplysinae]